MIILNLIKFQEFKQVSIPCYFSLSLIFCILSMHVKILFISPCKFGYMFSIYASILI
jgi:hypothetical protein